MAGTPTLCEGGSVRVALIGVKTSLCSQNIRTK